MAKARIVAVFKQNLRDELENIENQFNFKLKEFKLHFIPSVFLKTGVGKRETFFDLLRNTSHKITGFSVTLGDFSSPSASLVVGKYTPVREVRSVHKNLKQILLQFVDGTIQEPNYNISVFIGPDNSDHLRRIICESMNNLFCGKKLDIIGFEIEVYSPANNRWEPARRYLFLEGFKQ